MSRLWLWSVKIKKKKFDTHKVNFTFHSGFNLAALVFVIKAIILTIRLSLVFLCLFQFKFGFHVFIFIFYLDTHKVNFPFHTGLSVIFITFILLLYLDTYKVKFSFHTGLSVAFTCFFNPYSAGTVFIHHEMTAVYVRFWRIQPTPALKEFKLL